MAGEFQKTRPSQTAHNFDFFGQTGVGRLYALVSVTMPPNLQQLEREIVTLIVQHGKDNSMLLESLRDDYKKVFGKTLDPKRFGFSKLKKMILSFKSLGSGTGGGKESGENRW